MAVKQLYICDSCKAESLDNKGWATIALAVGEAVEWKYNSPILCSSIHLRRLKNGVQIGHAGMLQGLLCPSCLDTVGIVAESGSHGSTKNSDNPTIESELVSTLGRFVEAYSNQQENQ